MTFSTLLVRDSVARPASSVTKTAFDVAGAAVLLFLLCPLMLLIAAVVMIDGGGVIFAHERVGAGGRRFKCLKFRTMLPNSAAILQHTLATTPELAAEWAATRKLRKDPRVTPIGRLLRASSLDELPQLINVLRLEMSLVGPRPVTDEELPMYGQMIDLYYETRPGLTGLWQVSGRSNTSFAERVTLDSSYVRNWTLWQDIVILVRTVRVVLTGRGAR